MYCGKPWGGRRLGDILLPDPYDGPAPVIGGGNPVYCGNPWGGGRLGGAGVLHSPAPNPRMDIALYSGGGAVYGGGTPAGNVPHAVGVVVYCAGPPPPTWSLKHSWRGAPPAVFVGVYDPVRANLFILT